MHGPRHRALPSARICRSAFAGDGGLRLGNEALTHWRMRCGSADHHFTPARARPARFQGGFAMGQPLIADENGVRWITFDRPEIRNALYTEDLARIRQAVTGIGDSIQAIVLTGSGEHAFSAGMHMDTFAGASPED